MAKIKKERMFDWEQWRNLYEQSEVTSVDIFEAIGLPVVVFLRSIQRNGNRIPIPYKYEVPLHTFLKSRIESTIRLNEPVIVAPIIETVNQYETANQEQMNDKLEWIKNVREARLKHKISF